MKFLFFLFTCVFIFSIRGNAQSFSDNYTSCLFAGESKIAKRAFTKPVSPTQKINPLFYTGAALLFVYQNVFSEQLQANCAYHVSCSEAATRGMKYYGPIRGILVGINQLTSCLPGIYSEYPRCFITNDFKVNNTLYFNR